MWQSCVSRSIVYSCCTLQPGYAAIFRSLVTLSVSLTLLTVVLSAYIRLAEVGIGCDDWPACYAQLDPAAEKKGVTVLTGSGRDMAHRGARTAHRYIASVLGVFIVIIFAVALRRGRSGATSWLVPLAIFAITVFLSLLGYYTPTRSEPLITMGNLLGGMALLGLLWWLLQRDTGGASAPASLVRYRAAALVALGLVLVQIVLGGWSSTNYASGSCPGLLHCDSGMLAADGAAEVFNPLRSVELDAQGRVIRQPALGLLSMAHRLFALLTAGYLAWLVRRLKSLAGPPGAGLPGAGLRGTLSALSLFSMGQIVVGVSMIWLHLPLFMVTLHNALAAGLLLGSVNLLHRLTPVTACRSPG